MKANLIKAAPEVIPNRHILVNMVSRRVRKLRVGYRPRLELGAVAHNLGNIWKAAATDVIDLAALFRTFEMKNVQDSAPPVDRRPQQPASRGQTHRRRPPRFRPSN